MTDRIQEIRVLYEIATPLDGISPEASLVWGNIPYLLAQLADAQSENESLAANGGKYMKIAEKRYEMYEAAIKRAEEAEISLAKARERLKAYHGFEPSDYAGLDAQNKNLKSQIQGFNDCIERLKEMLAEAQRREQAAVEWADTFAHALRYRNDVGGCEAAWLEQYDEWRGTQETGKGEAE